MIRLELRPLSFACAALTASLGCAGARADDAGYLNSVRAGSYTVFYHTKADDISGPFVPPGANLKAENIETLYLAYVRSLSEHVQVELALGVPPLTKTKGVGPAMLGSVPYNGQEISEARWFAPALLLEYEFLSAASPLRPYVGVGVTYVNFYDRKSTAAGNAASGGPTRLSLTSSMGPAATVGLTYHVGGHWNIYGSYSISQVKTRLSADTDGVERRTRISFGPQALVVSVGYSF